MGSSPLPPLQFPVQTWPTDNDPSFISPFYSRCRIGRYKESDQDKRASGVYFRYYHTTFDIVTTKEKTKKVNVSF
jgi:hypothetical protein